MTDETTKKLSEEVTAFRLVLDDGNILQQDGWGGNEIFDPEGWFGIPEDGYNIAQLIHDRVNGYDALVTAAEGMATAGECIAEELRHDDFEPDTVEGQEMVRAFFKAITAFRTLIKEQG